MRKEVNRRDEPQFDHTDSSLDSILKEESILEEVEAVAIKRVLAWQLTKAMREGKIGKKAMAERMHTSRSQLDRLLDPENSSVNLETIVRAARALGKRIKLEFVESP